LKSDALELPERRAWGTNEVEKFILSEKLKKKFSQKLNNFLVDHIFEI
jgi:hypothetical protein